MVGVRVKRRFRLSSERRMVTGEGLGASPFYHCGLAVMKFGVFDHLDDAGVPRGERHANRLRRAEACDRGGFYAYHLAEHRGTPRPDAVAGGIPCSRGPARATAAGVAIFNQ
jgi:hypothetical protein